MGKKKAKHANKEQTVSSQKIPQIFARKLKSHDRKHYEKIKRGYSCLYQAIKNVVSLDEVDCKEIRYRLAYKCHHIEEQFILLRELVFMRNENFDQRLIVTQRLLDCLLRHHNVIYEGLVFGSSINGLGFNDSDVDLRLRALEKFDHNLLEPIELPRSSVEDVLKNIAYQTTRCSPATGVFAPSTRCPVAKLKFASGDPLDRSSLKEGINFDISMLSANSLGSFNSKYIRFLCHIEPKFHLLATVLKYWSKSQDLIQQGHLSSYALITMLIFFCQNTSPPLLPTVDQMNQACFRDKTQKHNNSPDRAILRQEWNCLISFEKESYRPSTNSDPLCLLLLKFFEFYLKFQYSSKTIISTRTGKSLDYDSFKKSSIYHEDFPLKLVLNIQDPFDLKHNVTAGLDQAHFRIFLTKIRISYERLFLELCKFKRPKELVERKNCDTENAIPHSYQLEDWGLNAIFVKVSKKAIKC